MRQLQTGVAAVQTLAGKHAPDNAADLWLVLLGMVVLLLLMLWMLLWVLLLMQTPVLQMPFVHRTADRQTGANTCAQHIIVVVFDSVSSALTCGRRCGRISGGRCVQQTRRSG